MPLIKKFITNKKNAGEIQEKITDIMRNLENVLNTKKGTGSLVKEFGIGDYNAYKARNKIVETIILEIKENITLYEPRVKLIHIQEAEAQNPFRLRFELKCAVLDYTRPIYIIFDSLFN